MASTDFLKLLLMQIVSNQPLKARYLSVYYVLAVKNASAEIIKSISNYMNTARYFRKNSELNKHVPHFKHMIPPRSSFALGPIVPLPRSSLPTVIFTYLCLQTHFSPCVQKQSTFFIRDPRCSLSVFQGYSPKCL